MTDRHPKRQSFVSAICTTGMATLMSSGAYRLTLPEEVVVIIGPSGTKSTLLRCINHHTPRFGMGGSTALRTAPECNLNEVRAEVGMVFQDSKPFNHLTAIKNVAIGPIRCCIWTVLKPWSQARYELERVGLAGKAGCLPRPIVQGQKQQVAIALSVGHETEGHALRRANLGSRS